MSRFLFLLIILISSIYSNAQSIETKAVYQYGFILNLDKDGNVVEDLDCRGIILIAQSQDQEVISVTIGDKDGYTGIIHSKKETEDKNTKTIVYIAIQEFKGNKIPLQIFEIYDLTKSSYIPDHFIVAICNPTTGKIIQSQVFHQISRVR